MNIIKTIKERFFMSDEEFLRSQGVKIGKGCYISSRKFSSEGYLIEIGDYVRIASGSSFYTHGGIWPLRHIKNDPSLDYFGKIKIGDYTSIGSNVMVMAGVTIGSRCIVGGGSVVTKSVPDGWMVAGNPARFIGYTDDFYNRLKSGGKDLACKLMNRAEKDALLKSLPEDRFVIKPYMKLPEKK